MHMLMGDYLGIPIDSYVNGVSSLLEIYLTEADSSDISSRKTKMSVDKLFPI